MNNLSSLDNANVIGTGTGDTINNEGVEYG